MATVLIVEDEKTTLRTLEKFLSSDHDVLTAVDGEEGLRLATVRRPDVLILDVNLPGMSGLDLCRRLREQGSDVPILFLTARDDEIDKLTGFGVGGDDYITKPASLLELEARLRVALRRGRQSLPPGRLEQYEWDGIVADFESHEVNVRGETVRLSAKEAALLRFFVSHHGKALSRDLLLDKVWQYAEGVSSRTVDTHVRTLRGKLRDATGTCPYIETVHGVGYKFTG